MESPSCFGGGLGDVFNGGSEGEGAAQYERHIHFYLECTLMFERGGIVVYCCDGGWNVEERSEGVESPARDAGISAPTTSLVPHIPLQT